jgi:Chaperone of endosialidase/Secretion system C-terminal sorting domain
MKSISTLLAAALLLGAGSLSAQICNSGTVIACSGSSLGQENSGTLGTTTGTEEWLAIGKSPFPANNGDFPYGQRYQRRQYLSLLQLEQRTGATSAYDTQIGFGNVLLASDARRPVTSRLDFEYIYQDQTGGFPVVTELNIATLTANRSKIITTTGTTLNCVGNAPCFGRLGVENSAPDYTLDVNGIGRMTGLILTSDARFKKDIATIEDGLSVVRQLRPTTYEFNTEEKFAGHDFDNGLQSGFIAQEMEKVLPHTVFTDEKGFKSVNYIAVVPYLVSAVQDLDAENQTLKAYNAEIVNQNAAILAQNEALLARLDALEAGAPSGKGAAGSLDGASIPAELFQNVPNPFNGVTEIRYSLPETVRAASLLVFDMNGKQLRSFDISARGLGNVRIAANELSSGMYLYTLLADGKEVGTRRMIITE